MRLHQVLQRQFGYCQRKRFFRCRGFRLRLPSLQQRAVIVAQIRHALGKFGQHRRRFVGHGRTLAQFMRHRLRRQLAQDACGQHAHIDVFIQQTRRPHWQQRQM